MADQTIDYDALAKQHGAISSTPPQGGIDYDALAKQHGAISSTPPPQDGGALHEAFVNPAKQVASGAVGLVGFGNKLAANTFDLLDKAAEHISHATGTEKGGIFRALADYTRAQQAISEKKAQELSGGRQDFVSQLYRQGTEAIGQIPAYAVAGHILGPTAGIAALSGLSAADQGPVEAAKAAAEGALTGGAMKVLGPGSRLLRATALGGATAAKAGLQGADPATALSQGITMGGMAALPPGGKTLKEAVRDEALYRGGQAVSKIATQVGGGNLNPVERAAVEEQLSRGVPVRFGTQTGNRAIQALEESTANTPLGAQRAAIFNRGTLEGLQGWAGSQAQELHPEAVTPESVGRAVPAKLDQIIAQEGVKRNAAYDRAWVGRDNPEFDEEVPVGYRRGQPVLNEEGQETGFHEQEPVFERVNMPVDISNLKMMAKPIYDQMNLRMAPAAQHASAGFHALEVLLKSPDYVPAWQAEDALGALKSMARLETGEGVRDVSQGIAAHLIPTMQEGIEAAVAKTGDDALAGLREARKIHAGIMDVDEIARKMRDKEPVGNFARLTRPKDTGIDYLHNVQNLAPEQMPAVGRAYFDDLITRVFREGDIRKTLGILNEWRDLGTENKKVLFPNESWRASADNLIKSLDMSAKILNTSGTELMRGAKSRNPFDWLQGYIGGKLFYTPEGINLLANAIKPQSPGSQALNMAKVKAAAGREGPPEEPPQGPPEEPPTGGGGEGGPGAPPPPPGAPPGSGGGAAALQGGLERNTERIAANREKLTPTQQAPTGFEKVGEAGGAIVGNMYDMLWKKVQAGEDTEAGGLSPLLQVAKIARDSGGLQSPEQFRAMAQEFGGIPRDANFQKAALGLAEKYSGEQSGRPDVESKPVQQQPGSTESLTPALDALSKKYSIDNPQNEYQYTTPEGIPVYKSPEGESTPPGGSPDVRLGPGDFLTEKPALHPAPQATPPGSSPGEPAIPPGTTGRAALQGGLERNQAAIEANKTKLKPAQEPSVLDRLDQAGQAATQRLRDAGVIGGGKASANAFFDPETVKDLAVSIAGDVARGTLKFQEWAKAMVAEHGPEIEDALRGVWESAQQIGERAFKDVKRRSMQDLDVRIPSDVRVVSPDPTKTVTGEPFHSLDLEKPSEGFLPLRKAGREVADQKVGQAWQESIRESEAPGGTTAAEAVRETGARPPDAEFWDKSFSLPQRARFWYELSGESLTKEHTDLPREEQGKFIDAVAGTSGGVEPRPNLERAIGITAERLQKTPVMTDLRDPASARKAMAPGAQTPTLKYGSFSGTMKYTSGLGGKEPLTTNDVQVASMFGIKGEDIGKNPIMYEVLSRFFLKLRDMQNAQIDKGAQPWETWQQQAPSWVYERIRKNPVKASEYDDYAQVFPKVIEKLQSAGIPVPGGKITMETLLDPRTPNVMSGTRQRFQETPVATVETATELNKRGAAAADTARKLASLDQSVPWVRNHAREYVDIQRRAMRGLAQRSADGPSLVSKLMSAITGRKVDVSRLDWEGYGTFEGTVSPNLRIPLTGRQSSGAFRDLDPVERKAFLAVLGQDLNQAAMAASHFGLPKAGATPDTFSVFIEHYEGEIDPQAIGEFSRRVGYPVNVVKYANGTGIDINIGGFDAKPTSDQVLAAYNEIISPAAGGKVQDVIVAPRTYAGDYLDKGDYSNAIKQIGASRRARGVAGQRSASELHGDLPSARQAIREVAKKRDAEFADWTDRTQKRLADLASPKSGPFGSERGSFSTNPLATAQQRNAAKTAANKAKLTPKGNEPQ